MWGKPEPVAEPSRKVTPDTKLAPRSTRVMDLIREFALDGAEVVELSREDFCDLIDETSSLRRYVDVDRSYDPSDYRRDEFRFQGPFGTVRVRCHIGEP